MRINTNVSSLNANRQMGINQDQAAKSMEKLSSGFRINRSGDDAAGLGIANKLRADTRALGQASRNAEQASSLLQVADGATGTIQKMLERMKELATQSASDNTDGDATSGGRQRIQSEFAALQEEITRTVSTTKFQGKTLLDGNFGATAGGTALDAGNGVFSAKISGAATGTYTIDGSTAGKITLSGNGQSQTLDITDATKQTLNFDKLGISLDTDSSVADATLDGTTVTVTAGTSGGQFMIGSSGAYTGADNLSLDKIDLTLGTLGIDSDDLTTSDNAKSALTNIDSALSVVATAQGNIGAAQNRIDYATDNLKTSIQNFSAAESVIRDVDMAAEMSSFSKSNILSQAAQSMLAQANQGPQNILQLLRG